MLVRARPTEARKRLAIPWNSNVPRFVKHCALCRTVFFFSTISNFCARFSSVRILHRLYFYSREIEFVSSFHVRNKV